MDHLLGAASPVSAALFASSPSPVSDALPLFRLSTLEEETIEVMPNQRRFRHPASNTFYIITDVCWHGQYGNIVALCQEGKVKLDGSFVVKRKTATPQPVAIDEAMDWAQRSAVLNEPAGETTRRPRKPASAPRAPSPPPPPAPAPTRPATRHDASPSPTPRRATPAPAGAPPTPPARRQRLPRRAKHSSIN